MNLEHIDPTDVIEKTTKLYQKIASTEPAGTDVLSRQVQALAYVLTEEINEALLQVENASD